MRSHGGIWPWALAAVAGVAAGVLVFQLGDGDNEGPSTGPEAAAGAVEVRPSGFAREAVPERLLDLYLQTGRDLGLDWSVLAAADQIEGGAGPAEDSERVAAIGYSLQAFGAPDDYRVALEAHGSSPGYSRSVLQLADRYRTIAEPDLPSAMGPLRLPVNGPIIAGFGQRLGVLHDGIDIDGRTGTEIHSAAAGLVVSSGTHSVFGQYTCVLHRFDPPLNGRSRITTCYGNQSRYAVEPGAAVKAGEVIGYVGCTGTCLRPHVHFQVRLGSGESAPVTDPAPFLESAPRIGGGQPLETPAS